MYTFCSPHDIGDLFFILGKLFVYDILSPMQAYQMNLFESYSEVDHLRAGIAQLKKQLARVKAENAKCCRGMQRLCIDLLDRVHTLECKR